MSPEKGLSLLSTPFPVENLIKLMGPPGYPPPPPPPPPPPAPGQKKKEIFIATVPYRGKGELVSLVLLHCSSLSSFIASYFSFSVAKQKTFCMKESVTWHDSGKLADLNRINIGKNLCLDFF